MENFEAVAAEIKERIATGEFVQDGRLPTERVLAAHYNLSRAEVRKALALIEQEGLLIRSVGRGTFVASAMALPFSPDDLSDISPADLNVARLLFEPSVAERAASHATKAELAEIQRCLHQSEQSRDPQAFEFWDTALHMAIARATHSSFVVMTYRALQQVRQSAEWNKVKHFAMHSHRLDMSMSAHRDIVDSILRRDGIAAREAMRSHLEQIGRYIANRD